MVRTPSPLSSRLVAQTMRGELALNHAGGLASPRVGDSRSGFVSAAVLADWTSAGPWSPRATPVRAMRVLRCRLLRRPVPHYPLPATRRHGPELVVWFAVAGVFAAVRFSGCVASSSVCPEDTPRTKRLARDGGSLRESQLSTARVRPRACQKQRARSTAPRLREVGGPAPFPSPTEDRIRSSVGRSRRPLVQTRG